MNIICLGGGPAGLYFALLMKQQNPANVITVVERNRPFDTFGWGVVLSDQTLANLQVADPASAQLIGESFHHWDDIEVFLKGRDVRSGGHGFCGIGRKKLLNILQDRCIELGVNLVFEVDVQDDQSIAAQYKAGVGKTDGCAETLGVVQAQQVLRGRLLVKTNQHQRMAVRCLSAVNGHQIARFLLGDLPGGVEGVQRRMIQRRIRNLKHPALCILRGGYCELDPQSLLGFERVNAIFWRCFPSNVCVACNLRRLELGIHINPVFTRIAQRNGLLCRVQVNHGCCQRRRAGNCQQHARKNATAQPC